MESRYLKNLDFTLLFTAIAITVFGWFMIYSASAGGRAGVGFVEKQIIWFVIGLIAAFVIATIDFDTFTRYSGRIYGFIVFLLFLVITIAKPIKGAQRWLGFGPVQIQPSEFAKIALIICLAVYLVTRRDEIRTFKTFFNSFLYLLVPILLIFKQPDLGTSLVLVAIWIFMVFVMGTDLKNIILFFGVGLLLVLFVWYTPGILKDYQRERVITFIDPSADPRGSGYHVTQSRIAIGSGQVSGKGFLKGTQRKLNFIPEQHTDFIFTVVGEETGFVGALALVGLYFIVLWRGICIMDASEEPTGRAIATGVVGMLLFHIFVNLGMTLGIMPVVGVPLPMFSYGGSSLMANLMGIGLLEGVSIRRHRINF